MKKTKPFGQIVNANKSEMAEQEFDEAIMEMDFQAAIGNSDISRVMG